LDAASRPFTSIAGSLQDGPLAISAATTSTAGLTDRVASWRIGLVIYVVLIADGGDSGILDQGRELSEAPAALNATPSVIPDARIVCIIGNINSGDYDG